MILISNYDQFCLLCSYHQGKFILMEQLIKFNGGRDPEKFMSMPGISIEELLSMAASMISRGL